MRYTEEKLQEILKSSSQHNQTYNAFLQIIKDAVNYEHKAALYPDLDSDSRAYNCGRAASITDLLYTIAELSGENELTEDDATNTDL